MSRKQKKLLRKKLQKQRKKNDIDKQSETNFSEKEENKVGEKKRAFNGSMDFSNINPPADLIN